MNDEIKEILDYLKESAIKKNLYFEIKPEKAQILLDYITNLQQDNEKIGELWREEEAHCILLQQENERLKELIEKTITGGK